MPVQARVIFIVLGSVKLPHREAGPHSFYLMACFVTHKLTPSAFLTAAILTSLPACQQATWRQQMDAAVFAQQDGRFEAAEEFFHAAERSATEFGPTDPRLAVTLGSLANFYHSQARDEEAELLYLESLELLRQTDGPTSARVGRFTADLALFYTALDRTEEAEPLYERALKTLTLLQGPADDEVVTIQVALASLYLQQKRYTDAELLYSEVLAILRNSESNLDQLLVVLEDYATLMHSTGRGDEGIPLESQAIDLRTRLQLEQ